MGYNLFGNRLTADPLYPEQFYALMTMSNNGTVTTISGTGTLVKALGTTTLQSAVNFTMPANNRLTYVGSPTIRVKIDVSGSVSTSTLTAKEIGFGIAKNGSVISTKITTFTPTLGGALSTNTNTSWFVQMATNDYIEIFISNDTDTSDVTLKNLQVTIIRI